MLSAADTSHTSFHRCFYLLLRLFLLIVFNTFVADASQSRYQLQIKNKRSCYLEIFVFLSSALRPKISIIAPAATIIQLVMKKINGSDPHAKVGLGILDIEERHLS